MLNNQILNLYGIQKKTWPSLQKSRSQISQELSNQSRRNPFVTMRCLYNGVHPCGKCPACLANRQRAFCFRLDQERDACSFYFWLTLQYDEDHVPHVEGTNEYCFSKVHCRSFFEKMRKRYKERGYSFKHFLVSEYGPNGTHRPHYHCLLLAYSNKSLHNQYLDRKEMREFLITEAWPHGHVTEKSFHGRVLSYLTKYCTKPELLGEYHTMKPFTLISPGIGLSYLTKIPDFQIEQMRKSLDFSVRYGSGKMQLPRYYVDKILPHSKKDLEALIPEDPLGDWSDYNSLVAIRKAIAKVHDEQSTQTANYNYSMYGIDAAHHLEVNREAKFEEFRSKLKNRKDL